MSNDPNPYETPIADDSGILHAQLVPSGPQGFPEPMILAWIGVALAIGIILSAFSQIGYLAGSAVLIVPPFRIAWVVYTKIQRRRYGHAWESGPSTFLLTIWIINVILLVIDAVLILLLATCLAIFSAST